MPKNGFIDKHGTFHREPPYPWRRHDGRTDAREIAAWFKYENMEWREECRRKGTPLPFVTVREQRWLVVALVVFFLFFLSASF